MDSLLFFQELARRSETRLDRAVLLCGFFKFVEGLDSVSVSQVGQGFEKAGLVKPRNSVLGNLLRKDFRVQFNRDTCRILRKGEDYFREIFPEIIQNEEAIAIGEDLQVRLRQVPFIEESDLADLQKMVSLYANLHILENSMRRFIDQKLEKHLGPDWWLIAANAPLKRKHEDRLAKELSKKWLPARSSLGPLYSIDWPDLISLMRKYEEVFKGDLGSINFLHRFEDLGSLRNVVAHHGFIDDENEFDRVRISLRDWTRQIQTH